MIEKIKNNKFSSVILVLILYSFASIIKSSPSMPSAILIFKSAFEIFKTREFYVHLFYTLKIITIGVTLSSIIGFVVAVFCSANAEINLLIMPIINSIKNIPSVALFPLFIILMGIGDAPRITIIIWNSVYAVVSSTMKGIHSIDKSVIEAAETCQASKQQIYLYIKIPLALIDTLTGIKIAMGSAFIAIVVAEMLGATKGLGYMILWSSNAFNYSDMYVYILVIALIGFSFNVIMEKIINITERKLYYE